VTSWENDSTVTGVEGVGVLTVDTKKQHMELHIPATLHNELGSDEASTSRCHGLTLVRFQVPEKINVDVSLAHGDIEVTGTKLECPNSLRLTTRQGCIQVGRVRSEVVWLQAPRGSVTIFSNSSTLTNSMPTINNKIISTT
jgi:hypothetical protein